ncbi:MAG: hypothetical protein K5657_00495 [Desulfovibrio sp.]|nr:hypothetical protein [Desulfovibrio sp.]
MIFLAFCSLLGIGGYAYVLALLFLTRQEPHLFCAAICAFLLFGFVAWFFRTRGWRILSWIHGLAAAFSAALFLILLFM